MRVVERAALGAVVVVAFALAASRLDALDTVSVDKCLASQLRIVGKGTAAHTRCYAKTAAQGVFPDTDCLAKAGAKITLALARLESKKTCPVEGSGETRRVDAYNYAGGLYSTIGHAPKKCDAAKTKLAGTYVGALANCHARAAVKSGVVSADCLARAAGRFAEGVAKAEAGIDCTHTGQTTALADAADAFVDDEVCALDPSSPDCVTPSPTPTLTPTPTVTPTPVCNNGLNEPGEPCDASAPSAGWGACRSDLACTDCTCACPTTMMLSTDADSADTVLDAGWTGMWHDMPVVGGGDVTVQLACPASSHPCGTCAVTGPIANSQAGAGQLDSRRCSTDSSKHCVSDAPCVDRTCLGGANHGAACAIDSECPSGSCPAAGTCVFYAGAPFPLSAAGIAACVLDRFADGISGTMDVDAGAAAIETSLTLDVYVLGLGQTVDDPCPRCSDPGGLNDGVSGGTCDGGPRVGLACDANGSVPGRPDFGLASLDCPPSPATFTSTLTIDLDNATGPVAMTLTASSPSCSGAAGNKCLCDTCNNANAELCSSNADCPMSGGAPGICGGRRCLGGPNGGLPCAANSGCPGSPGCARLGEPTKPTSCLVDDEQSPQPGCADADDDGEGVCVIGPLDQSCTLASGHAQRGCTADSDCGGSVGSCDSQARKCFVTGGGPTGTIAYDGTDDLTALGMADAPVAGVSHPTLASVFCVGSTSRAALNNVAGLPGPARVTLRATVASQP